MLFHLDGAAAFLPELAGGIAIALTLEAILGGLLGRLAWWGRAETWAARFAAGLDRRLNREQRSARARTIRGVIGAITLIGLAGATGFLVGALAERLDLAELFNIILLALALGQRRLIGPVVRTMALLAFGDLAAARAALKELMGRETDDLDPHGLGRAAVEACAERLAFGVVAPVVWFALLGLPGLFVQRAVDAADGVIGFKTPRHAAFGLATARINDALNLLPAMLAALLAVIAAAVVPQGTPLTAAGRLWRDPRRGPWRAAIWPEAAFAGALGLTLGGPRRYDSATQFAPWINPGGRARVDVADIRRALYLFIVADLLLIGLTSLLGLGLARS